MKHGKWIAVAALAGLALGGGVVALVWLVPAVRGKDSLERAATEYRAESTRLVEKLRDAERAVVETERRLADLSKALVAVTGAVGRLSETNKRLAGTVDQLAGIGSGLSESVDEADRIADAIRGLAGKSLDAVRGLQKGGGNPPP